MTGWRGCRIKAAMGRPERRRCRCLMALAADCVRCRVRRWGCRIRAAMERLGRRGCLMALAADCVGRSALAAGCAGRLVQAAIIRVGGWRSFPDGNGGAFMLLRFCRSRRFSRRRLPKCRLLLRRKIYSWMRGRLLIFMTRTGGVSAKPQLKIGKRRRGCGTGGQWQRQQRAAGKRRKMMRGIGRNWKIKFPVCRGGVCRG